MSKKIIIKPKPLQKSPIPQEIEAKIDAWVSSSSSPQQNAPSPAPLSPLSAPLPSENKEIKKEETGNKGDLKKVVRINFNVSNDLHTRLKVLCAKKGTTIKDLCIKLLEDVVK